MHARFRMPIRFIDFDIVEGERGLDERRRSNPDHQHRFNSSLTKINIQHPAMLVVFLD